MILLREIQEKDLDALERFAQIPGFINLQNDRELLKEMIHRAENSFADKLEDLNEGKYIFVAEKIESHEVLGTSMIATQHGTLESPHFYFEVGSEERFSETINTGFIHGTLNLNYDTNGPSEIGGLVMDPRFRNDEARIGRQISFVRFLFLAMNRQRFKKRVLAELLPPLNKKGQSPLWEAIGRRFTNMDYWEADALCQKNKEFIFSLFPTGKIYTTFLSAEARNAIGRVGKDTEPVLHMLKKIGFKYENQVDPFDGGPHLWADVEDIVPVKKMVSAQFAPELEIAAGQPTVAGLLCVARQKAGRFRAVSAEVILEQGKVNIASSQREAVQSVLELSPDTTVCFMPYY